MGRLIYKVQLNKLFNNKNLRFKIILLFILILILPLIILTFISLTRTYKVAEININKDLNHATNLFRDNLEDKLDGLKLRAKTLVDIEVDTLAMQGFPEKETMPILENELVKSDLDFIAIIEDSFIDLKLV